MRKGLLIVIAVLCSMLAQAEGVGREAAMRTAAAFLQGKGLTMSRATMAARAPRHNAPNAADAACYYVGCPVRCSEKQMLKSPDKLLI